MRGTTGLPPPPLLVVPLLSLGRTLLMPQLL